jgi:hypothetical protein
MENLSWLFWGYAVAWIPVLDLSEGANSSKEDIGASGSHGRTLEAEESLSRACFSLPAGR